MNSTVFPSLLFSEDTLLQTLKSLDLQNPLIIADSYNYPTVSNFSNSVLINSMHNEEVKKVSKNNNFIDVVGIGGCTALDFARIIGNSKGKIYLIPSILSTSCISNNKSIIYDNTKHTTVSTLIPKKIIISYPLLEKTAPNLITKWCHSGLGDLFGNISATIDYLSRKEPLRNNEIMIRKLAVDAFSALDWVNKDFQCFNRDGIHTLATNLYNSGINEILRGNSELNISGEHDLYYSLMNLFDYPHANPTHGELVSIGTLLTAKILGLKTGDYSIFKQLTSAYKKIELPTNFKELEKIGVTKDHLTRAFDQLKDSNSLLIQEFNMSLLNNCFAP